MDTSTDTTGAGAGTDPGARTVAQLDAETGAASDAGAVEKLVEEGRALERAARYGRARDRYERALEALSHEEAPLWASSLLRWIGRTYEAEGDHEAAYDCLEAALAVAEAHDSGADRAHALNCRGILYFRRGDLERAEELYRQAREMAAGCGEEKLVAMVDQNLGNVANVHGDHRLALLRYRNSLRRYRTLGLEEYVPPLLTNIGRVHTDLSDLDEAESIFRSAIRICQTSGDVSHHVLIKVNLTRLLLTRGDWQEAHATCWEAEELASRTDDQRWLGEICKHRGVILRELGRPAAAEASFDEAIAQAERLADPLLEAEVRSEMARLFRSQHRNREMLECLNRAHRAFEGLRARRDLADVHRRIEALERTFEGIVREWGNSIESTDQYTQGHCQRVADHACELARRAGFSPRELTWFRMGALLHDVGKVAVPPEILTKSGPLEPSEWKVMQEHPARGVELLADVDFPWDIRPMILHHHERWDGNGYPHGLAGHAIPLAARILSVADVFDALTTTRSYRRAFSPRAALEIMEADVGRAFDPEIFALFREVLL
ncbi:MAG: tetratricopeptide repeat protein, partial [Longimicrobiales bacterium]|nr:tetratricopeptide repeat protein [Longimicrobiales bacterium]